MARWALYPGCVSRGGAPELYQSLVAVAPRVDLEFVVMENVACTGAGVLHEKNAELADTLNARTFALAERMGLPLMTTCSTCQGVMSKVQHRVHDKPEYRAKINGHLAEEGLAYQSELTVKHFMWYLVEDFGLDRLKRLVSRPLNSLRAAPFYGCYIVRPTNVIANEYPQRTSYLEQIITVLGGEPVEYEGKDKCCGFPILFMNRSNSLKMTGAHIGEAQSKGADVMVTPCPLCHLNLDGMQIDAAKETEQTLNLPILHLPQLIGLALGMSQQELGLNRHIMSAARAAAKVRA